MFTGIVEEVGVVGSVSRRGDLQVTEIRAERVLTDMQEGDSICVDGACQTVTALGDGRFSIESVEETLRLTTLDGLGSGAHVNLERSLRPQDRLGGHIVLGHVDGVGTIRHLGPGERDSTLLQVAAPTSLRRYIALKGSIAVHGLSLTVAGVDADSFTVAIIPYTLQHTNLRTMRPGSLVNLEVDLIARYLERLMGADDPAPSTRELTPERLDEMGY